MKTVWDEFKALFPWIIIGTLEVDPETWTAA